MDRLRLLPAALLATLLLSGCTPTCEEVCVRLVDECGSGTELINTDECQESCQDQRDLYQKWDDGGLRDDFDASLECYRDSSCEDISAGACYNQDIWTF